jgi:hypothetical protein
VRLTANAVVATSVADPGSGAFLTSESSFVKFVATKNGLKKKNFHPCLLLLFLDPGSEIRDPGWVKIRIRDKHPGSATLLATILGSIPAFYDTVESEWRQMKQC